MPRAKAPGLVKMSHTVVRFNQMLCIVAHHFNKSKGMALRRSGQADQKSAL